MYAQLGNIVFDKAYTPDSLTRSDETDFVEHALINLKPRLQPAGNNLEEIELSVLLRAENVNIAKTLLAIKKSKDSFEVLPLVMGTGQFMGEYVITKIVDNTLVALADSFPIAVAVSISLKEYVVPDKLAQQQNSARKQAFAVGDVVPTRLVPIAKFTPAQITSKDVSAVVSQSITADALTRQFENNVSKQASISDKIEKSLTSMVASINDATENIDKISTPPANIINLVGSLGDVKSVISNFSFPITSLADLKFNNANLQDAVHTMKAAATPLNNLVTTRTQ